MMGIFYTEAITEPRARAMLAAIESTLPTAPLRYRIDQSGKIHVVDDPGAWCAANLATETLAVICNGIEGELVSLMASSTPPSLVPGGVPLVQVVVEVPPTPAFAERVPALVGAFGPACDAYWGRASPIKAGVAIAEGAGRESLDPGIPRPVSPSVVIPSCLAWVSYWSDATCRWLDFSPDDERASLFARVTPIAGHGVVLQLTEDDLDLDRPAHMAAVRAAYEAFPDIAGKWGW